MYSRTPYYEKEAREHILKGINALADAVSITLGPAGRNVAIESFENGSIHNTKDGVTVAKNFMSEDKLAQIGVRMIQQAAISTADRVGDGTTTSTVLARALVNRLAKGLQPEMNVNKLKRHLDNLCEQTIKYLESHKTEVLNPNDLRKIAMISANHDTEIANHIYEAYKEIGFDGVLTMEESSTSETTLRTVKGMEINKGWLSMYFVTDPATNAAIYEDVHIIITEDKIIRADDILLHVDMAARENLPLLIIADNVDQQAIQFLVRNRQKSRIPVVAIQAPAFGERRTEILEDIAILTGTKVFSSKRNFPFNKEVPFNSLGRCKRIVVSENSTIISEGFGVKKDLEVRIKMLEHKVSQIVDAGDKEATYMLEKTKERLAKLKSGVGIIRVGGNTEAEMKEKKDRMEDALFAVRAAIESGYLPGAGYMLAKYAKTSVLKQHDHTMGREPQKTNEELFAEECFMKALCEPYGQIITNAQGRLLKFSDNLFPEQYDSLNNHAVPSMIEAGIIDPTKVVVMALKNAVSVAGLFITTQCILTCNLPDKLK